MRSSAALVATAFAAALAVQPQSASATWSAGATGNGFASATSVNRAAAPTVTQTGSSVRLDWAAVTLGNGAAVTGYTVRRYAGTITTEICSTSASTRTCTDIAPPQGAAQYGVVAHYRSWTGQESPLTSFSRDVAPPVTTLSSNPAPNGAGWNKSSVTISLTATDPSSVTSITYRIGAGSPVTVAGSSTSFAVSAQGSTTISYYATDAHGNVETTKTYTVRIDTTAPAAPTLTAMSNDSGTVGDRVTNVAAQTLSGTAEAGATVTVSRGATTFPSVVAAANGTYTVPVTLLEGSNSFTAVASDPAGNSSLSSPAFTATLDSVQPSLTITDPKNGLAYRNSSGTYRWNTTCGGTPGACGTTSDTGSGVNSVTLALRDATANTCWTGTGTTFAACSTPLAVTGTSTWSKPIAYTVVAGRSLQLTVTVRDLAGNVTTGTVSFSVS